MAELRRRGTVAAIELYDERRACDFVWQQARQPADVCVFELSDHAQARFVWPYALHYPGILRLRTVAGPRRTPPGLTTALAASRLAVAGDRHAAASLAAEFPHARIRYAPLGLAAPGGVAEGAGVTRPRRDVPLVTGAAADQNGTLARAAARARAAGSSFDLQRERIGDLPGHGTTGSLSAHAAAGGRTDRSADLPADRPADQPPVTLPGPADVVVALPWPPAPEPPVAALAAMAAGCATIVHESGATAGWPALDPQTWQPRGLRHDAAPVVVSIDPRDEEHSLMLAIRRLAADAALRQQLGTAARAWWESNATPSHAAAAWEELLAEGAALPPPPRPGEWPRGFPPDGTRGLRELLEPFGVSVDFLR